MEYYHLVNKLIFINIKIVLFLGIKSPSNNSGNCIITVLDADDLPPLNSNTSVTPIAGHSSIDSSSLPTSTTNHNRRLQNNNTRNVLHRFLILHRSDQSQT